MDSRDSNGRFMKGRIASDEETLKRIIALEKTWKTKKNYIGDIKDENPYIFGVWRGIRYTNKGKTIGNSPEWNDFRTFYNDVLPTYKKGLVFRRLNNKENYNRNNFIWVTKEEASFLQGDCIIIKYKENSYTLKQLADKYNLSLSALKLRYHRRNKYNYTTEEIIFGRRKNRGGKRVRDYRISAMTPKQKASKMISSYKHKDKIQTPNSICDIDVEWMIENIFKQSCTYCGDTNRVGCDRLDNTLGHIKSNVVPCCYECNCARNNNFSYKEMKRLGKVIAEIKKERLIQT